MAISRFRHHESYCPIQWFLLPSQVSFSKSVPQTIQKIIASRNWEGKNATERKIKNFWQSLQVEIHTQFHDFNVLRWRFTHRSYCQEWGTRNFQDKIGERCCWLQVGYFCKTPVNLRSSCSLHLRFESYFLHQWCIPGPNRMERWEAKSWKS